MDGRTKEEYIFCCQLEYLLSTAVFKTGKKKFFDYFVKNLPVLIYAVDSRIPNWQNFPQNSITGCFLAVFWTILWKSCNFFYVFPPISPKKLPVVEVSGKMCQLEYLLSTANFITGMIFCHTYLLPDGIFAVDSDFRNWQQKYILLSSVRPSNSHAKFRLSEYLAFQLPPM